MSESVLPMFSSKSFIVSGLTFSSLAHFLIGSFIFLELSCRSCLYIFEISPLSVASFAMDTLSLTKEARIYNGEKTISLTSGAGKTGQPLVKE